MIQREVTISTLSPVHIGCDDYYEPTQFVISKKEDDAWLHTFDLSRFVDELNDEDKKELKGCVSGSACEVDKNLRSFYQKKRSDMLLLAHRSVLVTAELAEIYGKPNKMFNEGIARTAFDPLRDTPYLPGSSIKGSIRTALLNRLNKGESKYKEGSSKPDALKLEKRLLQYECFANDPFRHLKISDATPWDPDNPPITQVLYSTRCNKPKTGKQGAVVGFADNSFEALPSGLKDAFSCDFLITEDFKRDSASRPFKMTWDEVCVACNDYYFQQLEQQLKSLKDFFDEDWYKKISTLVQQLKPLGGDKQGFLLRIGRFSGAESLTIEGERCIEHLNAKPPAPRRSAKPPAPLRSDLPKSVSLASMTKDKDGKRFPFGWIWVNGASKVDQSRADDALDQFARLSKDLRDKYSKIEKQKLEAEQKSQKNKAEKLEKEKRDAYLATLSANHESIETLRDKMQVLADTIEKNGFKRQVLNGDIHNKARKLITDAREGTDWTPEEKDAAARMVEEWLPRVVECTNNDALKALKLNSLKLP